MTDKKKIPIGISEFKQGENVDQLAEQALAQINAKKFYAPPCPVIKKGGVILK